MPISIAELLTFDPAHPMPVEIVRLAERTEPFCVFCDGLDMFYDGPFNDRTERRNEGHFATRFGDGSFGGPIVIEGDKQLLDVYEVQAGDPGWILEGSPTRECCPNHRGAPLCRVRIGSFRVEI